MKQNHNSGSKSVNGDALMHMFQCPVCGGHRLSVIFEICGMRDIVGVKPAENVLFGGLDQQGHHPRASGEEQAGPSGDFEPRRSSRDEGTTWTAPYPCVRLSGPPGGEQVQHRLAISAQAGRTPSDEGS